MIVIFGATGNSGGEAARQLLAQGHAIRAIGRDRARLQPLLDRGAEVQQADLLNAKAVSRALDGAESAYVLIPPNFAPIDFRKYQQEVTAAVAKAIESSHCRKVVILSSMGAEHPEGTGPIVGLYELEQRLKQISGLNLLAIRAGYFMENFLSSVGTVQALGALATPAPVHAPLTLIAAADIGRYAAGRLAAGDFKGFEVVNLMGPALLTLAEITRIIGSAIGRPDLPYVQAQDADAKQGMVSAGLTEQMASLYIEMYRGAANGLLRPQDGTKLEHTTTPFTDFAQIFAAAYKAASAA